MSKLSAGLCAIALLSAGCAHGPHPLRWTGDGPPRLKSLDRSALYYERVRGEFYDERPEPHSLFGVRESGREYHTDENLAVWAAGHFANTLAAYGVPIVTSGETVLLRVYLTQLLVTEGNVYRGEMNFRV